MKKKFKEYSDENNDLRKKLEENETKMKDLVKQISEIMNESFKENTTGFTLENKTKELLPVNKKTVITMDPDSDSDTSSSSSDSDSDSDSKPVLEPVKTSKAKLLKTTKGGVVKSLKLENSSDDDSD